MNQKTQLILNAFDGDRNKTLTLLDIEEQTKIPAPNIAQHIYARMEFEFLERVDGKSPALWRLRR